jgi:DNA-binding SARP family transcriptional activator
MAGVGVRVLGGVRLDGGGEEVPVGGVQSERLLGMLVASIRRPVEADVLRTTLWGPSGSGRDTVSSLRMAVSRLRRRLDHIGLTGALVGERGAYRLDVPPETVDADLLLDLTARARTQAVTDPGRAITTLESALSLWRGEPFGSLASEEWASGTATRLTELRLAAEEELADLQLDMHREAAIVDRLQLAAEEQPLRERRWVQLATALYRLGRQGHALRALHRARTILRDELGIEPGEDLRRVEKAVLAQDPSLYGSTTAGGGPLSVGEPRLVGRDADIEHVARLVERNRLVTIEGLAGVGKSALARAVVTTRRAGPVVVASLHGLSGESVVGLAVATAAGIAGVDDPADVPAALAGRLRARGALLVFDGAEEAGPLVADLVDAFLAVSPDAHVLVTSRVPIGSAGEVRYHVEPLGVGTPEAPGPAVELFLDRVGHPNREDAFAVCARSGGLPLALELAAASDDQPSAVAEQTVLDAVRWSTDALADESRRLLARAVLLPDGLTAAGAAQLAGLPADSGRVVLAPLLHARLLTAPFVRGARARYLAHDAVRDAVVGQSDAAELDLARAAVVDHLLTVGRAVGELSHPSTLAELPAGEAELGNIRHWLSQTDGSEQGLRLAVATAPIWSEAGLGGEGSRWLRAHLDATDNRADAVDPLLRAQAAVAVPAVAGFFAASVLDGHRLEEARRVADEHGALRLWAFVTAHLAIARGWAGDVAGARELLEGPLTTRRLAELDDPWLDAHRDRLLALSWAIGGDFMRGHRALNGLATRFLDLGDPSGAVGILFVRAWLARSAGALQAAAPDLAWARELAATGGARGTQAVIAAELAHLARLRGEPSAIPSLVAAVDDLERVGNPRSAAAQRRDLGSWRIADGDVAGGLADLRAALPLLLRADRRSAAVALAEVARALGDNDPLAAARCAGAARHLLTTGSGPSPASDQVDLVHATAARFDSVSTAVDEAVALTDIAILEAAGAI